MKRLIAVSLTIQEILGVLLFALLTIVVTLQVATRFVLHLPMIWTEEAARFLFFWVVLTGASISVRLRRHFVIDLAGTADAVEGRTPRRRLRFVLRVGADLAIVAYAAFLVWIGIRYTQTGLLRTATNSEINMAVVYAAIPISAAAMVLYGVGNIVETLRGGPGEERPPRHEQLG